jgi:hypothetical protein
MAKSSFRLKKKPYYTPDEQGQVIKEELRRALEPVAEQHEAERDIVTSRWRHQPKFKAVIQAGPARVGIRVTLQNASESLGKYGGTIGDLWRWHNEGTQPHTIQPRFAKILRFVVGTVAVFARLVNHPGMKGKRHTQRINRLLRGFEQRQTRQGFRNGFKRLERENKRGRAVR